jgi:hypothetical protein
MLRALRERARAGVTACITARQDEGGRLQPPAARALVRVDGPRRSELGDEKRHTPIAGHRNGCCHLSRGDGARWPGARRWPARQLSGCPPTVSPRSPRPAGRRGYAVRSTRPRSTRSSPTDAADRPAMPTPRHASGGPERHPLAARPARVRLAAASVPRCQELRPLLTHDRPVPITPSTSYTQTRPSPDGALRIDGSRATTR